MNLAIYIVALILALVFLTLWILTIIHQAKRKRYTWMVFTILFNVTFFIYWITYGVSKKFRKV